MEIKSVIIDDEELAQQTLQLMLNEFAPEVTISGFANSAVNGILAIKEIQPDLIFLDVEMSGGTGFDMLDAIDNINFDVIFVTAHEKFALKAFKYEALDFLLKPVDPDELVNAVAKFKKRVTPEDKLEHRMDLVKTLSILNSKVPLPHKDGVKFIEMSKVIRMEADGSYVTIFSLDERPQVISKPLKFYSTLLSEAVFLRVHRSHLVNINYVSEFIREGGGFVVLENGERVQVADKKREMVLRRLSGRQ
jgi:two-component system LytT family response regulator